MKGQSNIGKRGTAIKVLSLFDGISCGRLALERAGIEVERYDAYEIDKYARQISRKNYCDIIQHGDVFNGDYLQYKGYDLLIGGSPCTYWSIAKTKREITPNGIGGELFMQYVRALKESNCRFFLYENNYSIHKDIKAFISEQLGVEPIMINSALVSAQSRKRLYWTNIPNVEQPADKGILLKDVLESGISIRYDRINGIQNANDKAISLCASDWRGINRNQTQNAVAEPIIINGVNGKSQTIKAQYANTGIANAVRNDGYGATMIAEPLPQGYVTGISKQVLNRKANADGTYTRVFDANKEQKANCLTKVMERNMVAVQISEPFILQRGHGFNKGGIKKDKSPTFTSQGNWQNNNFVIEPIRIGQIGNGRQAERIYSVYGKSVSIKSTDGGGAQTGLYKIDLPDGDYIIRKLTPIEAERLQTLPDNYTAGISDTQRYKCIGNGWTVDVIAHILGGVKNE